MLVTLSASPAMAATDGSGSSNVCVDIAQRALSDADVDVKPGGAAAFACLGDQVVVTANLGTSGERRVNIGVEYIDEVSARSASDEAENVLEVPYSTSSVASDFCEYGGYDGEVVSELQDDTWGCVTYGEYNTSTGAVIWQRHIEYEWTLYVGWNSAQNKLRTIPSEGSPQMSGTFTSNKQNGWWAPPTSLSSTAFTNVGNTTTQGYVVGQLNSDGQFSVSMGDVAIIDAQMAYAQYFGGMIFSHRFTCETSTQRCHYPNGEEAPL